MSLSIDRLDNAVALLLDSDFGTCGAVVVDDDGEHLSSARTCEAVVAEVVVVDDEAFISHQPSP